MCQVLGIGMTAVKADVINPVIQMKVGKSLLEGVQDGLEVGFGQ